MIAGDDPETIAAGALPFVRDLLGVRRVVVNLFNLAIGEVEWLAAVGRRRVHIGPGVRYPIQLMGDVDALNRGEHQFVDVHSMPPSREDIQMSPWALPRSACGIQSAIRRDSIGNAPA